MRGYLHSILIGDDVVQACSTTNIVIEHHALRRWLHRVPPNSGSQAEGSLRTLSILVILLAERMHLARSDMQIICGSAGRRYDDPKRVKPVMRETTRKNNDRARNVFTPSL